MLLSSRRKDLAALMQALDVPNLYVEDDRCEQGVCREDLSASWLSIRGCLRRWAKGAEGDELCRSIVLSCLSAFSENEQSRSKRAFLLLTALVSDPNTQPACCAIFSHLLQGEDKTNKLRVCSFVFELFAARVFGDDCLHPIQSQRRRGNCSLSALQRARAATRNALELVSPMESLLVEIGRREARHLDDDPKFKPMPTLLTTMSADCW